jgi:plastocyanin
MTVPVDWKRRWIFAIAALAAAVVLVSQDGGAASGATATASAVKVDINHFAFHPKTLRVRRGARVAFVNSSSITHTATRAGSFDTRRIKPGTSVVIRFEHQGFFAYHCKIHPFMHGKIVVE